MADIIKIELSDSLERLEKLERKVSELVTLNQRLATQVQK